MTGFGPFPGVPFNASERLVQEFQDIKLRAIPKPLLFAAVLPTDWRQAVIKLRSLVADVQPDVLLHFGVSSSARGFVIETRAFNQTSRRADCSGALAAERSIRKGRPIILKASLPAERLLQRLRMEGIRATLSADAGRYLCNAVLFESLALAEVVDHAPLSGFIHIAKLPPPERAHALPGGFGWDALRRGSTIILETLARSAMPG